MSSGLNLTLKRVFPIRTTAWEHTRMDDFRQSNIYAEETDQIHTQVSNYHLIKPTPIVETFDGYNRKENLHMKINCWLKNKKIRENDQKR